MAKKNLWLCNHTRKELETQVKEGYDYEPEELKNLIQGCKKEVGDIIEVNDWDIRARISSKGTTVHLVIEEDGCVRWYLNPDGNSDFLIRDVNVKKIGRR